MRFTLDTIVVMATKVCVSYVDIPVYGLLLFLVNLFFHQSIHLISDRYSVLEMCRARITSTGSGNLPRDTNNVLTDFEPEYLIFKPQNCNLIKKTTKPVASVRCSGRTGCSIFLEKLFKNFLRPIQVIE